MRLTDADKVQMKLFEECQNIRYFDKDRKKSQIFADGIDFAWVVLDNAPTVKAIPIEWIEEWLDKTTGTRDGEDISQLPEQLKFAIAMINLMEMDWEKENENR